MTDSFRRLFARTTVLSLAVIVVPLVTWWLVEQPVPLEPDGGGLPNKALRRGRPDSDWQRETVLPGERSWITNVQIIDLDDDGHNEILACDAGANRLLLARRQGKNRWDVGTLAENLLAPAHATAVDLDGDGDRDLVISLLGNIRPDDGVVGQLVWLENTGEGYRRRRLLDDVRRVADAQAGDLDGDGDIDLVVAVFGYARGQVLWLENTGSEDFIEHTLLRAPGTIHVPVADFDGDGDLDITAVVTQDEEEVWGFENLGSGDGSQRFRARRLWFTHNYDLGGAGLVAGDLDHDGDLDLLLPAGDNFEYAHTYPQPYHGCLLLRNDGGWRFTVETLAEFGGTYAAAMGDMGVVLVSMFNDWTKRDAASVVVFDRDATDPTRFPWTARTIAVSPTHLATVDCGDLDGDGRDDIVAGSLHFSPPFDRAAAIAVWLNRGADP